MTTWPQHRALLTVADCLDAFHDVIEVSDEPLPTVVNWFEVHVAAAVAGKCWLVAPVTPRTRSSGTVTSVLALDACGASLSRCGLVDDGASERHGSAKAIGACRAR